MSEVRMWAVKRPDAVIAGQTVRMTRKDAIEAAERYAVIQSFDWPTWKTLYRRGYRCVRGRFVEEAAE
jgi:hypothetical protein